MRLDAYLLPLGPVSRALLERRCPVESKSPISARVAIPAADGRLLDVLADGDRAERDSG